MTHPNFQELFGAVTTPRQQAKVEDALAGLLQPVDDRTGAAARRGRISRFLGVAARLSFGRGASGHCRAGGIEMTTASTDNATVNVLTREGSAAPCCGRATRATTPRGTSTTP